MDDDDLVCGCAGVLPIVGGILLGLAATAGWIGLTAWAVIRRVESRAWVRSAR